MFDQMGGEHYGKKMQNMIGDHNKVHRRMTEFPARKRLQHERLVQRTIGAQGEGKQNLRIWEVQNFV